MSSTVSVGRNGQRSVQRSLPVFCSRFSTPTTGKEPNARIAYVRSLSRPSKEMRLHVSTLDPPETTEHVMWFDKFPENWTQAHSEEELQRIFKNETERMIFIDFYAGFCGSCKAAYPALSRIAGDADFRKDYLFVKCNVSDIGIKTFIKKHGITGIPMAMVCAPGGEKLVTFGASFRKMNVVKANLIVMAANRGAQYRIDPNGFVMPLLEEGL